ncbi:MAG: hypothetical protein P3W98_014810 [Vibrio metschnikovii]|nr:hypothetical protein [Vibrio metschnikovii]MDM7486410.1 hypothetical protein [Vibrio metschnikovii]
MPVNIILISGPYPLYLALYDHETREFSVTYNSDKAIFMSSDFANKIISHLQAIYPFAQLSHAVLIEEC